MSYWHVCPYCGAYLDPGEKCDCKEAQQPAAAGSAANAEGQTEKKEKQQQEGRE